MINQTPGERIAQLRNGEYKNREGDLVRDFHLIDNIYLQAHENEMVNRLSMGNLRQGEYQTTIDTFRKLQLF